MILGFFMATVAYARDVISRNVNDLPAQARTTIKKHFPENKVSYIKIDKEFFKSTTYEVKLNNGVEINFDHNGNWKEVDGNKRSVPQAFVPKQIKKAANDAFPGMQIVKIEKENRGWKVELSNDADMEFDKNFNLREVD